VSGGTRIWSGEDRDAYVRVLREPARAEATSRVCRTFLARELPASARGLNRTERLTVPTRLVIGRSDRVITEASLDGFQAHADDMKVQVIEGGHVLPKERPDAVAERIGEMRTS
jgi:pimeloyl-ACP methyl ester carboxylesterase